MTVAALFVDPRGCYADVPGVDVWDEARDARRYAGPHPVVAHPPCARWCRLAGLVEARWGHRRGDDGGCFVAALEAVRRWGGVLEHPAFSAAFGAHGLPRPNTGRGWQRTMCGGWVCYVEQCRYGHAAKKATWLYAFGLDAPAPMRWGVLLDRDCVHMAEFGVGAGDGGRRERPRALVSWCGNRVASGEARPRLSKRAASATPADFRDALLAIAEMATGHGSEQ